MSHRRIAVVRLRGQADTSPDVETTLHVLRLRKRYTATIVDSRPSYLGMLRRVNDWVTWGEIDADTLALMLEKRGRLIGDKPLTLDHLRRFGWGSFLEFANAFVSGEVASLSCPQKSAWPRVNGRVLCIPSLKPFFRLHPPKGGLKSVKRHFGAGGDLGYRGPNINELIRRML